jgi:hypothetical protein
MTCHVEGWQSPCYEGNFVSRKMTFIIGLFLSVTVGLSSCSIPNIMATPTPKPTPKGTPTVFPTGVSLNTNALIPTATIMATVPAGTTPTVATPTPGTTNYAISVVPACGKAPVASTKICTVTLVYAGYAQPPLNWTAASYPGGVLFVPTSGTIAPGNTTTVTATIPINVCNVILRFAQSTDGSYGDAVLSGGQVCG